MAAVATTETVNITINDVEIAVPKGELIVESVKRLGLEIPIFCYHSRLKPVGMCRMCIVEVGFRQQDGTVRKMPKPQAACTLPASEGMAVYTDSEMVHRDRKGVLEFLLINHPLDCPICDRGGECPLQNNTLFYGPSTSRYVEVKRHLPKAFPLSKYVTLDLERCIQCGRCVRFTEEISGDSQLAFRFRGATMQPSTFELTNFDSKFSGNVIEICPVGALTNAVYRFRARPWDLETKPAICTVCSNGCNIWFDYRVGKMVRINGRTNDQVNEEWTCDRGKFGHEFYNGDKRLRKPLKRVGNELVEADWPTVYQEIIPTFAAGGNQVAGLGGANCSNEDLYLFQKVFRELFHSNNLDHRFTKTLLTPEQRLADPIQDTIASFEDKKSVLLFGTSLADEEPILFLRIRKGWFNNGTKVVVAHHSPTDADSFAHLILRYKEGTELVLAKGLEQVSRKGSGEFTPEHVARITGVKAEDIVAAGEVLSAGAAVVTTRALLNAPEAATVLETLDSMAKGSHGSFNNFSLFANEQGAEDLGILPDMLPGGVAIESKDRGLGTHQVLEACAAGKIRALWVLNTDLFAQGLDRTIVERALENVEFMVYQGIEENETTLYASVVLPMTAPAEGDGTFTNIERRVQRMRQVIGPKGEAKPGWRTYSEIMLRTRPTKPFFNPAEVMQEIISRAPWFSSAVYDKLGESEEPVSRGAEREEATL